VLFSVLGAPGYTNGCVSRRVLVAAIDERTSEARDKARELQSRGCRPKPRG
jgi:hypothetical protein